MARGSSDLLVKKNCKLESYLKRTVSEETYERIRAYESCIVISEKENKSFKYIVLGDEWIYLTENPPKSIQKTVYLGDVLDVELLNDDADFFVTKERKNIHHLVVTYLTTEPKKKPWRRSSRRAGEGAGLEQSHDRSNSSTPMGYAESVDSYTDDVGYCTQSTANLQSNRPDSQSSVVSVKDSGKGGTSISKKKKKPLNDSLDHESYLQALKEIEEDVLDEKEEKTMSTILSVPSPIIKNGSPSKQSFSSNPSTHKLTTTTSGAQVDDTYVEKTNCCFWFIPWFKHGKMKVTPSNSRLDTKESPTSTPASFTTQEKRPLVPDIEVEFYRKNQGSVASFTDRPTSRLSPDIFTGRASNRSKMSSLDYDRNRSSLGYASMSDLGESVNNLHMSGNRVLEKRATKLHVYLLNPTSPMHMLIKSAWNNFLIRSTLLLDPDLRQSVKCGAIRETSTSSISNEKKLFRARNREKAEFLFNQLKREILDPTNTMEETFSFLNELKNATMKNFALKKLFWRNSDLFLAMVRFLQLYLPKSPININTEQGRDSRIDEFLFAILVTEILSQEFRETEVIPSRIQTLKSERGKAVLDLLMTLTCSPDLPEKYGSLSKKADEELVQNLDEFTRAAVTAVFELFLMAQQANWNHSEGNFFNICWMVRVLEEIRTTEKFVERVINQMMELLSPSKLDTLVPEEAVMLYQQFSIISNFLNYSPRITNFIRSNYEEEFKYFIQVPAVAKKLPSQYPLSSHTVHLMDQVINKVLSSSSSSSIRVKVF